MIFAKSFFRLANRANYFRAQIFFAANPVVDFFCERIAEKSVHGEIAARRVSLGVGEDDYLRTTTILIIHLGAEGGDLELMSAFDDDHHAEFSSDGDGAFEKFLDLFRLRVRGDVEIIRLASEQKIAHAAADPERGETRALQIGNNFLR